MTDLTKLSAETLRTLQLECERTKDSDSASKSEQERARSLWNKIHVEYARRLKES